MVSVPLHRNATEPTMIPWLMITLQIAQQPEFHLHLEERYVATLNVGATQRHQLS